MESVQKNRQDFRNQIMKDVVGCTVLTRYNNKTYRIDDIDWDQKPTNTFETKRDGVINYVQYYK